MKKYLGKEEKWVAKKLECCTTERKTQYEMMGKHMTEKYEVRC